jgi:dihydroxyacetone kinase-like protein
VATDPALGAQTIISWLNETESEIAAQSSYLTQLDAAIGDGDHGTNMTRGFTAVGRVLAEHAQQLAKALDAAIGGIVELGAATPGDKTMIDALTPASAALHRALDAGEPLQQALAAAVSAAGEGAESTVPLQARKGRASYLGERSIGHLDPGAASSVIILTALQRVVAGES